MDLGGILSAATSGSAVGILGTIGSRALAIWELREKRKDMVLQQAQEVKRWGHETELLQMQMKARAEETEQELSIADAQGGWEAFTASQQAEASIHESYKWVEAVRALTRPALTLETQVLLAVAYFTLRGAGDGDMRQMIVEALAFNANMALAWWFGERAQPRGRK